MEINLEQPIFAIYIDIDGLSAQKAQETLMMYNDYYGKITNVTFWIFPAKETKIELIWNGSKYKLYKDIKDINLQNLIKHVNEILEILANGTSDQDIKAQLRNLQLSKILD